jgi:hypothetical protein
VDGLFLQVESRSAEFQDSGSMPPSGALPAGGWLGKRVSPSPWNHQLVSIFQRGGKTIYGCYRERPPGHHHQDLHNPTVSSLKAKAT